MFGSRRNSLLLGMSLLASAPASWAQAPTVGPNTNMVTRGDWTTGDPFLQRQNEPSLAVSTRNVLEWDETYYLSTAVTGSADGDRSKDSFK